MFRCVRLNEKQRVFHRLLGGQIERAFIEGEFWNLNSVEQKSIMTEFTVIGGGMTEFIDELGRYDLRLGDASKFLAGSTQERA